MAGYDTNRPRPTDSGSFVGLPGDAALAHGADNHQTFEKDKPKVVTATEGEDDTGPTLQSVPQAVPPLDRRVSMLANFGESWRSSYSCTGVAPSYRKTWIVGFNVSPRFQD